MRDVVGRVLPVRHRPPLLDHPRVHVGAPDPTHHDEGYGFGLAGNRGVITPYGGVALGDAGNRTVRTGTRWQLGPDLVLGVEATRQTSDASEADNELMLRAALRF